VWAYLGPPGACRGAQIRLDPGAADASPRDQGHPGVQLAAGAGRRLDTSHAPIMHRLLTDNAARAASSLHPYVRAGRPASSSTSPITAISMSASPLGAGEMHARTYHFILPFHQIRASSTERGFLADAGHIWVPIDDETSMVYNWPTAAPTNVQRRGSPRARLGNGPLHVDQTTFRSKANRQNDYLIDRAVQRTESFTGIDGSTCRTARSRRAWAHRRPQQRASGPGRQGDHQMRRLLRQAVKTVEEGGTPAGAGRAITRFAPPSKCCRAMPTGAGSRTRHHREKILQTV